MLNEYHLQFLHHFLDHGVRFTIIGGQARRIHYGSSTRDLDIWVDIRPVQTAALEEALLKWSAKYPSHTCLPLTPPLVFAPAKQVSFPDDDCWFQMRSGEVSEIRYTDRVDILTSVGPHDFDGCHSRATLVVVDGMNLPFLSEEDSRAVDRRSQD